MGRKGGNKQHRNRSDDRGPRKQVKVSEKDQEYDEDHKDWEYNHPTFEAYYRRIFLQTYFKEDSSEFDVFWQSLKEKLPIVFRVNKVLPNHKALLDALKQDNFIQSFLQKSPVVEEKEEEEDKKVDGEATASRKGERFEFSDEEIAQLKLENITFYPEELVWQMNCHRAQLKKSMKIKALHRYIQQATDSGLLSRQELVSMIPPLLLGVEPHHTVFDMCAAPGSKTAQLLELMYGKGGASTSGTVIANDVDQKRAYLLTHQVGRLNPSGLVVINHPAQFFPTLQDPTSTEVYDKKFYFDRVQADVPCSGDGATRKIPTQWRNWHTKDAQTLHPLQLAILQRALNVCKVGGYVVYSTCSINPIEDESVLTETFRRATAGSIELVDVHHKLPGLKGRPGLSEWPVACSTGKSNQQSSEGEEELLQYYSSFEAVDKSEKISHSLRSSMFAAPKNIMEDIVKIQRSMRILPHDQDTGGFFIALIKKNSTIVWDRNASQLDLPASAFEAKPCTALHSQKPHQIEDDLIIEPSDIPREVEALLNRGEEGGDHHHQKQQQEPGKSKEQQYKEVFRTISIEDWENIVENYGIEGMNADQLVSSVVGKQSVVRLISSTARKFINCDDKGIICIINMGTRAFERQRETFQGLQCRFRLIQDAAHIIGPLMSKRKVEVTEKEFLQFLSTGNVRHSDLKREDLIKQLTLLGAGSIMLSCKHFGDYVVSQNTHSALSLMINKETQESFRIRYCLPATNIR